MKRITLNWWLHPDKGKDWYASQKAKMTEDALAREIDIDYSKSITGKVFPEFQYEKHVKLIQKPEYNQKLPLYRIWDFGGISCTLYLQVDHAGRKTFLHERILESGKESNAVDVQIQVAAEDTFRLFPAVPEIIDICDPAGNQNNYRAESTDIQLLQKNGISPRWRNILSQASAKRKKNARAWLQHDLQKAPGGKEAIQIQVSETKEFGCPTLIDALLGGYCYKKDGHGNLTYQIEEKHPFEDVMDCVFYLYLEMGYHTLGDFDNETHAVESVGSLPSIGRFF